MKKKITLITAALLVSATMGAYAEFGIGIQGGVGTGGYGASLLISPATPESRLHLAFDWALKSEYSWFGVSIDYWFLQLPLTSVGSGSLDFFVGGGLYGNFGFDPFGLAAGVRVPVGIDLRVQRLELFIQAVPRLNVDFAPSFGISNIFFIGGNIGIRGWIG